MDRHRQEWLDYACSEEVLPDVRNTFIWLFVYFWELCIYYVSRAKMQPARITPEGRAPLVPLPHQRWRTCRHGLYKTVVTVRLSYLFGGMIYNTVAYCVQYFTKWGHIKGHIFKSGNGELILGSGIIMKPYEGRSFWAVSSMQTWGQILQPRVRGGPTQEW